MKSVAANWDSLWAKPLKYGHLTGWERKMFCSIGELIIDIDRPLVLSAGCGRGLIDYWIVRVFNCKVSLLDSSKVAIKNLKKSFQKINAENYELTLGDIFSIPYEDKKFDLVWNEGVLEHFSMEQRVIALKEMARTSKDKVLLSVPYAGCKPYLLAKKWLEDNDQWSWGVETPIGSLEDEFAQAGLKMISQTPIGGKRTTLNYVEMVPEKHRQEILSQLSDEDLATPAHLMATGTVND